jgi:hypothetical protein
LGFNYAITYNVWDVKTKQHNYLGVIWVEKLGNDIMKDLKHIGAKLMCVFFQWFPHWKQFVAKWV